MNSNISPSHTLTIPSGSRLFICLNGHAMATAPENSDALFRVLPGGLLDIHDCSLNAAGKIKGLLQNDGGIIRIRKRNSSAVLSIPSFIYNGQEQTLFNSELKNAALSWSSDMQTWENELPKGTAAGSYSFWCRFSADDNPEDFSAFTIQCNSIIMPKPVTIKAEDQTLEESDSLANLVSADGLIPGHRLETALREENGKIQISSVKIFEGDRDVSKNYEITLQNGTLTRKSNSPVPEDDAADSPPEPSGQPDTPAEIPSPPLFPKENKAKETKTATPDSQTDNFPFFTKMQKEIVCDIDEATDKISQKGLENGISIETDSVKHQIVINTGTGNPVFLPMKTLQQIIAKHSMKEPELTLHPFLQINEKNSEEKELTDAPVSELLFEIQPMLTISLTEDGKNVVISTEEMEIHDKTVTVTLTLPDNFIIPEGHAVKILHTKDDGSSYIYETKKNGSQITFDNPNGFSSFKIFTEAADSPAETEITETEPASIEELSEKEPIHEDRRSSSALPVLLPILCLLFVCIILFILHRNKMH